MIPASNLRAIMREISLEQEKDDSTDTFAKVNKTGKEIQSEVGF